jgi:hypothetical protein
MVNKRDTPFTNIESAYRYVALLREALDDANRSVEQDLEGARTTPGAERRVEAFRLVAHKLKQLRQHVQASLILLNDLRTLRRLLLGERGRASEDHERTSRADDR